MWLRSWLIGFAILYSFFNNFTCEIITDESLREFLDSKTRQFYQDAHKTLAKLKDNFQKCMGDHKKHKFDDSDFSDSNDYPDLQTPASVYEMFDSLGDSTIAQFYDIHKLSAQVASNANFGPTEYNMYSMEIDAVVNERRIMKEEMNGIYNAMKMAHVLAFWERIFPQLNSYMGNGDEMPYSVALAWHLWASELYSLELILYNVVIYDRKRIGRYNEFVSSCMAVDMNNWFSGYKAMMNRKFSDGSDFPRAYLGEYRRDRRLITDMARAMKSVMCEAIALLGACDQVLNASDIAQNEHMSNAIDVYKELSERFIDVDRDIVENARVDIARTTHYFVGEKMHFSNDTSLAEQIRRKLKFDYYWLDFSVIVFEADSMYGRHMAFSEYANGRLCPCVLRTRPIGALNRAWKAIVFVAPTTPKNNSNERTWRAVEKVVKDCSLNRKICEAKEFFDNTTDTNGGYPVASYFATTNAIPYPDTYPYMISGPAVMPGRRAIGDEEFRQITWNITINWAEVRIRTFTVAAAVSCDTDIFKYQ